MLEAYWYIVSESNKLRDRTVAITVYGRHLVFFRDKTGLPVALENRCRHRNVPLSDGSVCEGRIRCPYHGWVYDSDGKVSEIPASGITGSNMTQTSVSRYHCIEQQGYLWVCLSHIPVCDKPPVFPFLEQPGWTSFRMKTRFHATVEACLENFLDCPHAAHVHRGWFRSHLNKKVRAIVRTLEDGAEAEFFEEPREKSAVWSLLSPGKTTMKHTDRFIAPATSQVDYQFDNGMAYSITSCCTPVDSGQTEVFTVISFRVKWLGQLVKLYFKPLAKTIIRQDVAILDQQSRNIARFGGPDFVVTDTDLLHHHIHAWRKAIVDGEKPPEAGIEKHIELYF
ncbi:MAG TPA: aromatic ring-hydroxylating dioxygenase subunit alpha [Crenotrichaceae bacterium]|nr:aromatic ring-hydroxylating dioxygenase subunit alpha [Crenotrichaceae bacterium]